MSTEPQDGGAEQSQSRKLCVVNRPDPDRDRYFCAALTGLCANPEYYKRTLNTVEGCGDESSAVLHCAVGDANFIADEAMKQRTKQ